MTATGVNRWCPPPSLGCVENSSKNQELQQIKDSAKQHIKEIMKAI
jgi:hypothetical protein